MVALGRAAKWQHALAAVHAWEAVEASRAAACRARNMSLGLIPHDSTHKHEISNTDLLLQGVSFRNWTRSGLHFDDGKRFFEAVASWAYRRGSGGGFGWSAWPDLQNFAPEKDG